MVLFCFFDSPFTMNSHPNLPRFLRKTAQICLCIDMCGAKKTVETFSEWPHRAHRRMAKPPQVPMGSVVNGHAPAYRFWWLYTYTHLEWGTWGTAAFLVGEARENTTTRPPGAPPRAHQAPSTSHWRTRTKLGPSGPSITAISIQKLVTKVSKL